MYLVGCLHLATPIRNGDACTLYCVHDTVRVVACPSQDCHVANFQCSPCGPCIFVVLEIRLLRSTCGCRYVKRAMHGTRLLSWSELRETYGRELVNLKNEARYGFLNTLFSVSEAVMYMQVTLTSPACLSSL